MDFDELKITESGKRYLKELVGKTRKNVNSMTIDDNHDTIILSLYHDKHSDTMKVVEFLSRYKSNDVEHTIKRLFEAGYLDLDGE